MNKEELQINLKINGRNYPVKLKNRDEEEAFRRAASQVELKLIQYKSANYNVDDPELYMGMVAIQALSEKNLLAIEAENKEKKLEQLTKEINNFLKDKTN